MSTFEPISFTPRPLFDMSKQVRLSNIKYGKKNVQIEVVRSALCKKFPLYCPDPSDTWDNMMMQGVLLWQRELGHEETGVFTREELVALSEGEDWEVV